MYRSLRADQIVATADSCRDRIQQRFPGSGLSRVAEEVAATAGATDARAREIARPFWSLRALSALLATCLLAGILVIVIPALALRAADIKETRYLDAARTVVAAYNDGDDGAMRGRFTPEMDAAFPPGKAAEFFADLRAAHGKIAGLDRPRLGNQHFALVPVRFERGRLDIKLALDARDRIAGLFFLPHTPDIPVPERHETRLSPPFRDSWLVYWGGETREQNYHVDTQSQRRAFDLLGVGPDGKTRRGSGKSNEDYHCFGREILAPADGLVVEAIDGVHDNAPGSMNPFSALGNAVLIEHRAHEVSVLAHLKDGSVRVKAGERVRLGKVVGLCGNSGNSSEPHLHYHLQNTPVIQDATGIPARFASLEVGSERRQDYSPVKGDLIRP